MARFCFYCGRELKTGEKCGCRTASQHEQPNLSQHKTATKPEKNRQNSLFHRLVRFFNPFAGKSQGPRPYVQPTQKKTSKQRQYQSFRLDRMTKSQVWQQMRTFMTRPVDAIEQADREGSVLLSLTLLALLGLSGGLFLVIGIRQPQLQMILSLNSATASAGSAAQSYWFLFIQGFGMGLVVALLLVLTYHLALRAVFRTAVSFVRLLISLSPACLFMALFLVASLLVLPGSVFSAFMMLVAGFGVSAIAQYLVMRRLTSFDDNRCFILVSFVLLIDTSILALLLNLALPVLNVLLDYSVVF
ncbi:MAG: hypothetical protein SCM11_21225 [Bacillota bacterium]|nr:hypothetical protein [Bacillota bacterium]